MSNILKKIVAIVTALTVSVWVAGPGMAQAQTVEELQAQINALLAQLAALQAQLAALTGGAPTGVPAACTGITFERNLRQGMSGNDVKCLQALLNTDPETKVAETGAGSPGNETTFFGPKTKAAVVKFQEKYAAEILTPLGLTAGTGVVGPSTRAKLNALLTVPPPPPEEEVTPPPVFEPLTVKLAEDTPPMANLQKGVPNNVVLKVVLTGSETETVNITGLTVTNYGTARATNEISYVKLFDENGIQLSTDRPLISNQASFVFVPALSIAPKGSRTISVAVDLAAGAETLRTVQLGIASASAILGANFTGTFPIKGNVFTIVPAGALGSISVNTYGSIPKTAVKIGEKEVVFNRFTVSVGAREGVKLTQVTVKNTETTNPIVDTDLTNIKLREIGGAVVAGPVNLVNKKAVLNLVTPLSIPAGGVKKFEIVGDIVSGNTRRAKLEIEAGKVLGIGETSGVTIVSTGSAAPPSSVTIGIGSLTIGQSANHPTGAAAVFIKSTTSKVLGVFSVKAEGEDILVNTIKVNFATSTGVGGKLTSVGLYDGDALVSDLKDEVASGDQEFSLNWIVSAGVSKNLAVKAITSGLDIPTSGTVTLTWKGASNGYGLASGETISTTDQSPLSAVTIYKSGDIPTLTIDTTKTPLNQGVLVNLSDVLLGSIKIRVGKEDMKLIGLKLTTDVGGATSSAVSSIALYDVAGNILTKTINYSGTNEFKFESTDFTTDVNFTKDTYKTILVKGRTAATTSAGYFLKIAATADLTMYGYDSTAEDIHPSATLDLGTATQGKFTITDKILEVKKAPDSPSGSVTRDSAMVAAILEISNPTASDLTITKIKLTSKTGLPTALIDAVNVNDALYFKLYDELGTQVLTSTTTLAKPAVTFEGTPNVTVPAMSSKTLTLKINTTDTGDWPSGTSMHWTIAKTDDVAILETGALVGYGGTVWSIPADTNVIRIP